MARQGVFNREVTQLERIKRSVQQLNHRHTTTLEEGVIIPNFSEYLYPNETLRLKTTNFLRTIPLKTPQLTRVRVVQRFVAFPLRLLWEYFPEYINALNPPAVGIPEEPYIVNFNRLGVSKWQSYEGVDLHDFSKPQPTTLAALSDYYYDTSACGIGQKSTSVTWSLSRLLFFKYYNHPSPSLLRSEVANFGYQFFPHELGDYLNAPLYTACLATDTTSRFSAYKFAAYQLAYSFFYRRPNIEEYVDDFYEMARYGYSDQLFSEFPSFYANYNPPANPLEAGTFESPLTTFLEEVPLHGSGTPRGTVGNAVNPRAFKTNVMSPTNYPREDIDLSKDTSFRKFCRWEDVEHFPLKAGPNMVMQLKQVDAEGRISWSDSTISLTRLRYAPWFLDRFTSANPWPQRGSEALIPVTGNINVTLPDSTTVTFSGLTTSIPEHHPASGSLSIPSDIFVEGGGSQSVGVVFDGQGVGTIDGPASTSGLLYADTVLNPSLITIPSQTATTSGSTTARFSSTVTNVQYALSVSPSNFRFYMQLQHMKEMSGMTDGRYKSFLSMFFGSHDQDYRLDRPEFIGGFVQDLDISEVIQTSETTDDSPLGAMAGRGVSAKRGSRISYHAFEHALVMGFLHIVPDVEYIGGLNRQDNTTDPFDWVLPQFSGLSEQPIRMKELVCQPSRLDGAIQDKNNVVFGYEPRFNERRARHSFVTGAFRDTMNSTGSYEYFKPWLVTRNFGFEVTQVTPSGGAVSYLKALEYTVPTLSKEFVSTRHNLDYSNFEVTDPSFMKPFILDSFFEERLTAIIPRRGIPKI